MNKDETDDIYSVMWYDSRIAELTEQLQRTEDKGRVERESLLDHLHGLTTESTAAKLENQSLKVKHLPNHHFTVTKTHLSFLANIYI